MSDVCEHVMISRSELAEIIMKAKGFSLDEYEVVNLDIRSTSLQRIYPLYNDTWATPECPYDLFTIGIRKKNEAGSN